MPPCSLEPVAESHTRKICLKSAVKLGRSIWEKPNSVVIGMQIITAVLANGLAVTYEVKHRLTISPNSPTHLGIYAKEMKAYVHTETYT